MSDPVYVSYTVQKGDTLWNLWKKSEMTKSEWVSVNDGRDPQAKIHVGDKIVIKDPIVACEVLKAESYKVCEQSTGGDCWSSNCEDRSQYNRFKPLRVYTEALTKGLTEVSKIKVSQKSCGETVVDL